MLKRAKHFLTRRQFHKIAAFILACATIDLGKKTAQAMLPEVAADELHQLIMQYAPVRDNPWLLIHGIRATGKDFSVGEEKAIDYLCSYWLTQKLANGVPYLYMPTDYEHHPHCFLSEAVLDSYVPLDYAFQNNGQTYSVADLVKGAKALFEFDSSTSDSDTVVADRLAWSLTAFAYTTDPAVDTWTNSNGKQIRFSTVIESAIAVLERGTKTLQSAILHPKATPTADRVHDFACAGTHLIYGLTTCVKLGHHQHGLPERMKAQFDILIWRLDNDLKLIDSYYNNLGSDYPADVEQMYRLDTKLKFLGHAFETINYAHQYNLFETTTAQQEIIARGRQGLRDVVQAIVSEGIEKHKEDRILFELLVGDSCHAYHAISMEV
jgi:hypothetical protein